MINYLNVRKIKDVYYFLPFGQVTSWDKELLFYKHDQEYLRHNFSLPPF